MIHLSALASLLLAVPPVTPPVQLEPHPAPEREPEPVPETVAPLEEQTPLDTAPGGAGLEAEGEDDGVGALSRGGTDSGILEIGLASATLATAAGLIAFGIIQIDRGRTKQEVCGIDPGLTECQLDRPVVRFASAGLSFGLSIPLAVAGGLWMRKGVRIRRDWKAFHAGQNVEAQPVAWAGREGAGAGLRLRW